MLFNVRGKNRTHECCLRVYADSPEEAEAIGFKRGLFVTEVALLDSTTGGTGKLDRIADALHNAWRREPTTPLKCFGRAVTTGQAAALVLCGVATWIVDLRALVLN